MKHPRSGDPLDLLQVDFVAEAFEAADGLAREEGIFAGVSSGLNVVGALALARELGRGKTVVTVAVDTGLKYLSGDLFDA